MTPATNPERDKNHRFPPDIISHAVWVYFRFTLSYRGVEEIMLVRGIVMTYEAIRKCYGAAKHEILSSVEPSLALLGIAHPCIRLGAARDLG